MSLGEKDASEVLGSLQGKGDHFTKLSVAERKRVADLEDAIAHISAETEKYRSWAKSSAIDVMNLHVLTPNPAYSRADGVDVGRQAAAVTKKVLTILEMKLNKLLQRQSEIIIVNKALKKDIDHYRLCRTQTNVSHAKFEHELAVTKQQIEEKLAESAAIVEERERLVAEKERLEKENEEEQAIFQEEYERLGAYIKKQNDALEESLLKERKEDKKKSKEVEASIAEQANVSKLSLEEEVEIAKQMGDYTKYAESEQKFLSGIEDKIAGYESMFEKLKETNGAENLEDVVAEYVKHEDEMFSLYNFVQTCNSDIDAINEETLHIDAEISNFKKEQEEQDSSRRKVLDKLTSRQQAAVETAQALQELNVQQKEAVHQVSKKIHNVFYKLQCDQMDAKQQNKDATQAGPTVKGTTMSRPENNVSLLASQGVTEMNVVDYLGCIEQRAVDIIGEYLRMKAATDERGALNVLRSPTPGPHSPMVYPVEPVIDFTDLPDDHDEDENLIDLNAFKEKMMKKAITY